jgi:hypothetical protein
MNKYKYKTIKMIAGKEFYGHEQHFKILDIWNGEATVQYQTGDYHRVERGPVNVMQRFLQMVVDGYQSMEDANNYVVNELPNPKIRLVAIWPDDWQYGGAEEDADLGPEAPGYFARAYTDCIYDIETGEVYE